MRVPLPTRISFAILACIGACIVHASPAKADVSSWLSVGGGYGYERNDPRDAYDRATAMSFALGVGSDPTRSVVLGGMLRTTTRFSLGTDLGLAARAATGGFAR